MNDRRDEGISAIIQEFLANTWRPGKSHQEYADKYGVTVSCVRGWSAEAARFLRLCRGNEEEFREHMLSALSDIADRCRDNVRTFYSESAGEAREYPSPDYRNWIAALDLRARVYGITKNEQPGAAGNTGSPMEIPVEELKAALEQAGYRIEKVNDGSSREDPKEG